MPWTLVCQQLSGSRSAQATRETAARWMTPLQSATAWRIAAASRTSSRSDAAEACRSRHRTGRPDPRSARASDTPINPAAPVTSIGCIAMLGTGPDQTGIPHLPVPERQSCGGSPDAASLRRPGLPQQASSGILRLAPRFVGAFGQFSVDHGRTSPAGLPSIVAPDAHAGSGGGRGRSRSIRRRISANSARGTATSASWNTT